MLYFKSFANSKGQSLVEGALIAPLIVFFLFAVIWFGRIMLTWQQIEGAARYGTDMIAYTDFGKDRIIHDITHYLYNAGNIGRTLSSDKDLLKINPVINDFPKIDRDFDGKSIADFNPFGILNMIKEMGKGLLPLPERSYVEITYSYKAPAVLKLFNGRLNVKARSEILSGTGSAGAKERSKK